MHILRTTLAAAASTLVALGLVVAPVSADHASAATVSSATTHLADPAAADAGKANASADSNAGGGATEDATTADAGAGTGTSASSRARRRTRTRRSKET